MPGSWSIRHYLIALIMAMALPLLGLLIYSFQENYDTALDAAGRNALRVSEIAATDISRFTRDTRQFLHGLAKRPQTRRLQADACDPLLAEIKELFPQFANIAVTVRDGQMICSALRPNAKQLPSVGGMTWFKEAAAKNGFDIGAAHLGPISKKWVVVFSEAIQDAEGNFAGLIGYSLDLAAFPLLVADSGLPPDMSLVVVDDNDTVIMRTRNAPKQIGERYARVHADGLTPGQANGFRLVGDAANGHLITLAKIPGTDWQVIGSRPTASVLKGLWLEANLQYIGASVLILIGSLLALYVGRHIVRPVQQIALTARHIADGDLDKRAALSGPREITSVASQFNKMLDVRLKAEAKYRNLLETASDAIIVTDAQGIIVLANRQAENTFRYDHGSLLGCPVDILVPQNARPNHHVLMQGYLADPQRRSMGRIVNGQRRDGSQFPCDIGLSPLQTEDGLMVSAIIRDLTERAQFEERLTHLAQHDALTQLPNRTLLHDRLEQAVARAERAGSRVAVVHVDIDRFGELNDFFGTVYADGVLVGVAEAMRACLRDIDSVIRSGSDEFIAIIEDATAEIVAQQFFERLREQMEQRFREGERPAVTLSGGAAIFPCEEGLGALLKHADLALSHARAAGGASLHFFERDMDVRATERREILSRLSGALARGELSLHYQPQVATHSGRIVGAEALLRWNNPELGAVAPNRFIPLAEESGLIEEIGEWVLRSACQQTAQWLRQGLPAMTVAVNLSARQFHGNHLLDTVQKALADSGLAARHLELEITEGMLMDEPEKAAQILAQISRLGIRIAIDDFGTGYSSLAYLRRFPVNVLKVDQSFVRDVPENQDAAAIVRAVVSLAHSLRLDVIAEGVENQAQRDFLGHLGCPISQGYLFSRPLPPNEFAAFITAQA